MGKVEIDRIYHDLQELNIYHDRGISEVKIRCKLIEMQIRGNQWEIAKTQYGFIKALKKFTKSLILIDRETTQCRDFITEINLKKLKEDVAQIKDELGKFRRYGFKY